MPEIRSLHVQDTAETFDEALSLVVQIIEREGFHRPMVSIEPVCCDHGDDDVHWFYGVSVNCEVEHARR